MFRAAARIAALAVVAMGALGAAPNAIAAPVDLTSVTEADRLVTATWMLPAGASAWSLQISADPTFGAGSIREVAPLGATENTFTSEQPLAGGTYHMRVISTTTVDECVIGGPACVFEYSNVRTVTIGSQAATLQGAVYLGGLLGAGWVLPAGAESWEAEVSTDPSRNQFGFLNPIAASPAPLTRGATTFATPITLQPGTYFVHIVTTPTYDLCLADQFGCVFEYSNVLPVTVQAAARPSSLPPVVKPRPAADKVLELGAIKASSEQDIDKLVITLRPEEAVEVKVSGSVNVPGASKVYRFKTVNRSLEAGTTRLRLKLASGAKRVVKRALRRMKKLSAKFTLVVTDDAGNSRTKKYSVRLKP